MQAWFFSREFFGNPSFPVLLEASDNHTHWIVVENICSYSCTLVDFASGYPSVTDAANRVFISLHSYMDYSVFSNNWNNATAEQAAHQYYKAVVDGLSYVPHHRDLGVLSQNVFEFHPGEKLNMPKEGLSEGYQFPMTHLVNRVPLLADPPKLGSPE